MSLNLEFSNSVPIKVHFLTNIHNSKIKFIFFSSEINQLEIINQSVLRMFIKPYNSVLDLVDLPNPVAYIDLGLI
jgi:hypothetical protein